MLVLQAIHDFLGVECSCHVGSCVPSFLPLPARSYCRNLPATYTRQDVGEMFLQYGTVLEIRL